MIFEFLLVELVNFVASDAHRQINYCDADSAEQWWDTLTHELYHAQQAICGYYGVDVGSEDGAWTMGYLMRQAVGLLAPPCR